MLPLPLSVRHRRDEVHGAHQVGAEALCDSENEIIESQISN